MESLILCISSSSKAFTTTLSIKTYTSCALIVLVISALVIAKASSILRILDAAVVDFKFSDVPPALK